MNYCERHYKLHCQPCRKAEDLKYDWGIFRWDGSNRYPRAAAVRVYKYRKVAEAAADKMNLTESHDGYVVRSILRPGRAALLGATP